MPKITRIAEQLKNKDRISVYVDGAYSISLTIGQLLEEKLKVGDALNDQDIKRLQKLSDEGKLKMRTIDWLMIRPRSAKELHDYLRRKNLEPDQISAWIDSLQKAGYQNDINFSRWWAEQRRNKQRSAGYIRQELRSKGIDQEIINNTLAENETSDNEALKLLIEKKRRNVRYQDNKKLTEYLQRQGYRYSDIADVLAE